MIRPQHYENIPDQMLDSLVRYVLAGTPTGGFLFAVLSNDLKEACGRADDYNIGILHVYCCWLWNSAPLSAWGSPTEVHEWIKMRRTNGPLHPDHIRWPDVRSGIKADSVYREGKA